MNEPNTLTVSAHRFCDAIAMTKPFVSGDDSRPLIRSHRVETRNGDICIAATDGYTMGVARIVAPSDKPAWPDGFAATLDYDFVKRVVQIFKPTRWEKAEALITIAVNEDTVTVDGKDATLRARLVPGDYPDYADMISSALTSARSEAPPPKRVGLNAGYLTRFHAVARITAIDISTIEVFVSTDRDPTLITCGETFVGLIMPVRLQPQTALPIWVERYPAAVAPALSVVAAQ